MADSALDSRRLRNGGARLVNDELLTLLLLLYWLPFSFDVRPQGRLRARSARVSRRFSGGLELRFAPPPHSRRISVSWASELRRRRWEPEYKELFYILLFFKQLIIIFIKYSIRYF